MTLAREYKQTPGLGIYAFNPGLMDTDLVRKVEVVQGYGEKLKGFRAILRMWVNPPTVPAEKALWLASAATDGKTGLEVSLLGPARILGGLVRDQGRKLLRRPAPEVEIVLTSLEPYTLEKQSSSRMRGRGEEETR